MHLGVSVETREAHLAFNAVQRPFGARLEAMPGKLRRGRDGSEIEDKAIRYGRGQQPFRRPLISWAIEFLRRRGFDDPNALGGQRYIAVRTDRGVDRVV